MIVRITEIKAAGAVAMVDLHILRGAGTTAVGEALTTNPAEDPVELGLADFEGVLVPFESVPIVVVDRQGFVDATGAKCETGPLYSRPKILAKNLADSSLSRAETIVWSRTMVTSASSQ